MAKKSKKLPTKRTIREDCEKDHGIGISEEKKNLLFGLYNSDAIEVPIMEKVVEKAFVGKGFCCKRRSGN